MRTAPAYAFAAACALLAAATAVPNARAQLQPMGVYWPNEDGRQWLYDQHYEELVSPFDVVDNQARLYLDGTTTAPGGIAAQLLKGSIAGPPAVASASSDIPSEIADPLLRNLWRARPDLRSGIYRTATEQPCVSQSIPGWYPLLLTGGLAYVKNADLIGAWRCNAASTQAWLWLTSDVSPGSTAQLQLVPDLAEDVILYLTVQGLVDATVPAGAFPNALHVDYRIDYGESSCTGPTGKQFGTFRSETKGYVRYAPGVGPIECFEEFENIQVSGDPCPGFPPTGTIDRSTLKLNSPSVPSQVLSWGAVKSRYR